MLLSAVQQSEPAIDTHTASPLFFFGFPFQWGHHRALSTEFPELYSRFSLVIYFTHNINVNSIYWWRRWHPLQCSCLENPMHGGAWWAAVHAVAKSRTRLRNFTFTFHFHALEKEMATHSSVLAWRIPGKGEPDGLPSMGSHRVGHDWSDLAALYIYIYILTT